MVNWKSEMDATSQRDDELLKILTCQEASSTASSELPAEANVPNTASSEDVDGGSLYEHALAAASARLGLSPEAIMEEDFRRLSDSTYPTPECLTPDELDSINLIDPRSLPAWAKDRLRHVYDCQPCRRLFASMHPDTESRDRFHRALEQALTEEALAVSVSVGSRIKSLYNVLIAQVKSH